MYIQMTRIRPRFQKITEAEFNITKQFLDMLDLYCDDDYTIHSSEDFTIGPLKSGQKILGFTERYKSINSIPKDLAVFRPLKNEKHADLIIQMFENFDYIEFDTMEINDYEKDGKIKYSGWLVRNGKTVEGSYIKTSPSQAILKLSILAALLMDGNEHKFYMENLMDFLHKGGNKDEARST